MNKNKDDDAFFTAKGCGSVNVTDSQFPDKPWLLEDNKEVNLTRVQIFSRNTKEHPVLTIIGVVGGLCSIVALVTMIF